MDFEAKAAAAEEKRKKELHTELGRKDAVELDLYAKQLGIDISDAKTPEDKRAAIELQAEEQAKAAMADARIKHMEILPRAHPAGGRQVRQFRAR
jgi:hypothetical protein